MCKCLKCPKIVDGLTETISVKTIHTIIIKDYAMRTKLDGIHTKTMCICMGLAMMSCRRLYNELYSSLPRPKTKRIAIFFLENKKNFQLIHLHRDRRFLCEKMVCAMVRAPKKKRMASKRKTFDCVAAIFTNINFNKTEKLIKSTFISGRRRKNAQFTIFSSYVSIIFSSFCRKVHRFVRMRTVSVCLCFWEKKLFFLALPFSHIDKFCFHVTFTRTVTFAHF